MATEALSSSTGDIRTLLFDLDGTLVGLRPFRLELVVLMKALWLFWPNIRPWRLRPALWRAVREMQTHQTGRTNFTVLTEALARESGFDVVEVERRLRRFFHKVFPSLASHFIPIPQALETLQLARALGYRVVLATNPVWPEQAVHVRLHGGGLRDFAFDYITHSEIMSRCKPDVAYFEQVLAHLGTPASECLMIGNDVRKDLPAKEAGIRTFLVHHPQVVDARVDAQGTLGDLQAWLKQQRRTP